MRRVYPEPFVTQRIANSPPESDALRRLFSNPHNSAFPRNAKVRQIRPSDIGDVSGREMPVLQRDQAGVPTAQRFGHHRQ